MKNNQLFNLRILSALPPFLLWLCSLQLAFCFYNPSAGRWLNRDPLRQAVDLNIYGFTRNSPVDAFDPDGQITVKTLTEHPTSTCGSFDIKFDFMLDTPAAEDGYIVQENSIDFPYTDCTFVHGNDGDHFWEAWFVKAGQRFSTTQWQHNGDNYTDHTKYQGEKPGKSTGGKANGSIKFFFKRRTGNLGDPGANPPTDPDPSTGWTFRLRSAWSGDLPSTRAKPSWWDETSDNGEAPAQRSIWVKWTCCPGCQPDESEIIVTPLPGK
jgi:hypothetical protein